MSNQEQDDEPRPFHLEASGIVFDKPKSQEEIARDRREHEQHEFARAQVKTNWRLLWFTGLLVLGTFCGTAISVWQATISRTAANAAQSAANTANQTLQHMVTNDEATKQSNLAAFKQEQRAYVAFSWAAMSNPPTCQVPNLTGIRPCVDIHFVNTGRTPAVGIHLYRKATFGKTPKER